MISEFSFPTRIVFGPGAIQQLGQVAESLGMRRLQIVTDAGLVRAGLIERIALPLQEAGIETALFDQVHSNPVEEDVELGGRHFREQGCDGILGAGGGSSMDVAKAVRARAAHEGPLEKFTTEQNGWEQFSRPLPPLITVPTTSGTGSEVGRGAVITMEATGRKALIFSPELIAGTAVCDPELVAGLPPSFTAWTGADALTHNVESYLSNVYHPICEGIALRGVQLCFEHLASAVADGQNLGARQGMMMAALLGGIAFQKDLGVAHSLAHPLSVHFGLNHGLANGILLPHALRFNRSVAAGAMQALAAAIGENGAEGSPEEGADRFIGRVGALLEEIRIPSRLSNQGIEEKDLELLVPDAWADPCHAFNPRPCTESDLRQLYEAAL